MKTIRDQQAADERARWKARARLIASIPAEDFEALMQRPIPPSANELYAIARKRAAQFPRKCPHCGAILHVDDVEGSEIAPNAVATHQAAR